MSDALVLSVATDIRRALHHCRFWGCITPRAASLKAMGECERWLSRDPVPRWRNARRLCLSGWLPVELRNVHVDALEKMLAALSLWPVRSIDDIRRGAHELDCGSWSPSWDDICGWLASCPPLVEIETFFVEQDDGHLHLLIIGVEANTCR